MGDAQPLGVARPVEQQGDLEAFDFGDEQVVPSNAYPGVRSGAIEDSFTAADQELIHVVQQLGRSMGIADDAVDDTEF